MNTRLQHRRAFSLLELLLTIAIIMIVAALLLPALQSAQAKARRTQCMSHLKQIGLSYHAWAHEHGDKFPMEVSTNERGTLEFAQPGSTLAFKHFQALSNELIEPRLLKCPSDRGRVAALTFGELQNSNVSYLVNLRAVFGNADSLLAADRNIRTSGRMEYGFIQFGAGDSVEFSSAIHGSRGNVLFADAHVDFLATREVSKQLTNVASVVAAVPELDVPTDPATSQPSNPANNGGSSATSSGSSSIASSPTTAPTAGSAQSATSSNASANPDGSATIPPNPSVNSASEATGNSTPTGSGVAAATSTNNTPPSASSPVEASARSSTSQRNGNGGVIPVPESVGNFTTTNAVTNAPPKPASTNTNTFKPGSATDQPGDNEFLGFAHWLGKAGTHFTYWFLFLALAILVAIEIIRRRRKKKASE